MKRRHLLQTAPLLTLPAWSFAEGRHPDSTKTLTLICSCPAGGGADQRSRQIGRYINTALNLPVIIDNRGGVDITSIPYKGGAPATVDLIGGQVDMMFEQMYSASSD